MSQSAGWRLTWILIGSAVWGIGYVQPLAAQVTPDDTLPVRERSQVSGSPDFQINGGARRGGNLFHSFRRFSVPTGGSASFNNAAEVRNIFARVTGRSASNIDGLIQANGTANLFLLNPNGILFGPNASLNIGGSFIASTAKSINFANRFQFSATNPQTSSLLTVSVPVGLQMGANPGRIGVQGNGYDLSVAVPIFSPLVRGRDAAGLRVPVGQTLALIGGNINLDGATLTAEQGRIELGSVRNGQVSLSDGFTFSYLGVQTFGDIRLSRQALADASGGGSIQVQGHQVSLADGSLVLVQNGRTQTRGSIRVNAAQSLELSGSSPDSQLRGGLYSETVGTGRGADITVSTRQLIAQDGAGTVTDSYSSGDAGNVTINSSDSIQLIGFSSTNPTLNSAIGSGLYDTGDGGTTTVLTRRLSILDGGSVATAAFGMGNAGNVTVNATEVIEIIGVTPLLIPSNIISNALNAGTGSSGSVTINTARLILQGGIINSSAVASGNAGNVTVNASEAVEISGRVPGASTPAIIGSSALRATKATQEAFGLPDRPSGNSGSATINTPRLNISDGARVTVSNEGTGNAGTLQVNAHSIALDRGGSITAVTASGEGGNIDLNVRDFVLLRNNSQITTSAGGNGGNIRINAGSIVAVPSENGDIRANSVNARGGNITINASGVFGLQPRPQNTALSDITATGATSALSGAIDVTTVETDPTAGLAELPTELVDSSRLIAQGCPANQGNSFIISGRGGLPPTPEQQLDDDAEWSDRRQLVVVGRQGNRETQRQGELITNSLPHIPHPTSYIHPTLHPPTIEATGWQQTPTGEIRLTATTPEPQHPVPQFICASRQ
jgi:filamentous hemagglutinin family protein